MRKWEFVVYLKSSIMNRSSNTSSQPIRCLKSQLIIISMFSFLLLWAQSCVGIEIGKHPVNLTTYIMTRICIWCVVNWGLINLAIFYGASEIARRIQHIMIKVFGCAKVSKQITSYIFTLVSGMHLLISWTCPLGSRNQTQGSLLDKLRRDLWTGHCSVFL